MCLISSMRPRPRSKLITYQEVLDFTSDPTRPTVGNFAVFAHVVTPFQYRIFFRSILSLPLLPLPRFHRHYLLTAKTVAPDFVHKDPRVAPPAFLPPSTSPTHAVQSVVLQYFQENSSLATPQVCSEPLPASVCICTDDSCPDQYKVGPHNPAGWGVYVAAPYHGDHFGSVGHLPFPFHGSW